MYWFIPYLQENVPTSISYLSHKQVVVERESKIPSVIIILAQF